MERVLTLELPDTTGVVDFLDAGVTVTATVSIGADGRRAVSIEAKAADGPGASTWRYEDAAWVFPPSDLPDDDDTADTADLDPDA